MFKKRLKIFLQFLGPIILFYILFFKVDYRLLFEKAKTLQWHFLILAALGMVFEIVLRSVRWRAILTSLNIKISFLSSVSLYWLGAFVGVITPGRLGELIKVYFLKNRGHGVFRSFFSIILDRILDVLFLLFLGILVSFFFLKEAGLYIISLGVVVLAAIIFIFLLLDERSFLNRFLNPLLEKFLPGGLKAFSRFGWRKLWQGIKGLKKEQIFNFVFFFVISWIFYFFSRYLVALSLGIELSFLQVCLVLTLAALVTLLPISIAGLGTREISVIYLFSLFGLSKETGLLFSLLIFSADILTVALGIIPYLRESSLINEIKKAKEI